MRKILFLDIDGVLNSEEFYINRGERPSEDWFAWEDRTVEWYAYNLDPRAINVLKNIVTSFNLEVVLSSTWRLKEKHQVEAAFARHGYPISFLSRTYIGRNLYGHDLDDSKMERGVEIEHWILTHISNDELKDLRIAILDDDSDMGRLMPWLVKVQGKRGLTKEHGLMIQATLMNTVHHMLKKPLDVWKPEVKAALYP